MTAVFLDSNVLVSDYRLRSAAMGVLLRRSRDALDDVLIPNLALAEAARTYEREYRAATSDVLKGLQRLERLRADLDEVILIEDVDDLEEPDDYEGWLGDTLAANEVDICSPPQDVIDELVRRASARMSPFDSKGHGFRDAIIWLTVVRHLQEHDAGDQPVFISNDRKAFWSDEGLKPALVADLAATGFGPGYLSIFDTVTAFVTSRIADDPAVHNEVSELVENEFGQVVANLEAMLMGVTLDIYGAYGDGVITGLVGRPNIAVDKVGATEVENDYLVTMRVGVSLLVEVEGYDPQEDHYLIGEWNVNREVPVSGIWSADQKQLDKLTLGIIDDLHPGEGLGI